jgi:hypothetical protein
MKKLTALFFVLVFSSIQMASLAFADETAKIKIKITGATNNKYLCIMNVGCLSIRAAQQGKVFPIFHPIEVTTLYVTDAGNGYRLSSQGLPSSCNTSVGLNKTLTITGSLGLGKNGGAHINQLHCAIS